MDVHGDETAVRVGELGGRDEAGEGFRVGLGEGFHDELVEIFGDLLRAGVRERPHEVHEEVVLGGGGGRGAARTAASRG